MTGATSRRIDPARLRGGLTLAATIGLTVSVVVAVMAGGTAVIGAVQRLSMGWLAAALMLSALSWVGQGLGFAALTKQGVRGRVWPMTRAFLGGDFAALITPFGSGGIPVGIWCLAREGLGAGEASAVIAMHSLLTGAFFVVAGLGAAVVVPAAGAGSQGAVWGGLGAMVLGVAALVWLIVRPATIERGLSAVLTSRLVERLLGAERARRVATAAVREAEHFSADVGALMRQRPGALALSFAGLVGSRLCLVAALPAIMIGLGWTGDVAPLLATAVGALALAIVSPSPGGSGAVEAGTTALLATQTSAPTAAAAALVWRAVTYYPEVLAGWFFLWRYLSRKGRPEAF